MLCAISNEAGEINHIVLSDYEDLSLVGTPIGCMWQDNTKHVLYEIIESHDENV